MLIYIVPNSDYNTEQVFNLSKASMIMYDFDSEVLTIQYDDVCEYDIKDVSEYEYNEIKDKLIYVDDALVIKHKQN